MTLTESEDNLSNTGTLVLELELPTNQKNWMIRLPDANSAINLSINGANITSIGNVSSEKNSFLPGKGLKYSFFETQNEKTLVVLQVANFALPYTGLWDSPIIGTPEAISKYQRKNMISECLITGAILFMGLYHLFMFFLHKKDKSALFFAIICFCMAIRNLLMNERILMDLFHSTLSCWRIAFTIEHLSAHMCLPLFFLFIKQLYPNRIKKFPLYIVLIVSTVWAILEIFTPQMIHHRLLSFFEYFLIIAAIYLVVEMIIETIKGKDGAWIILIGLSLLLITSINDVLFSNGIIESFYIVSIGLFCFTFCQSLFLAQRQAHLFTDVEQKTESLSLLNKSLERFIPKKMISFLHKDSIVDVKLGDVIQQKMTVFFLDIRNFTSYSEVMTPEANFLFINSFLETFGPIIRKHNGFIDKYLGDGFMALFPDTPDNALEAAIEMQTKSVEYNKTNPANIPSVEFGIGIHTGNVMLGTVGESQRMDTTVISDTVNTASRLEQLNKVHKTKVLVSAQTIASLKNPESFRFEKIGDEAVKGKTKKITVYKLSR